MDAIAQLSRREREIMDIIFSLKEATLSDVQARMQDAPTRPALRSLLTILESKGHLKHGKSGREFVYQPTQETERVGISALGRVVKTFFNGSIGQAMGAWLSDPKAKLSTDDLKELEDFLQQARSRKRGGASASGASKKP